MKEREKINRYFIGKGVSKCHHFQGKVKNLNRLRNKIINRIFGLARNCLEMMIKVVKNLSKIFHLCCGKEL